MIKFEDKYNKKRYQSAYNTTVFSISLVMLMLGLLVFTAFQTRKFSRYVRENIGVQLELTDDVDEAAALALKDSLEQMPFARKCTYVSKEQAAQRLNSELGEEFIEFMGYIPLPASIEIFLNSSFAKNDSIASIEERLLANPVISKVSYQKSLVSKINKNLERIGMAVLTLALLLLVVSVILIYNTIRLAIFSRRLIIKSMILVGATEAFIRRPFIIGGLWQGLISGALGSIVLFVLLLVVNARLDGPDLLGERLLLFVLFSGMIVFAALITFSSNYFAVKKYLKINSEELY